MNFPITGYIAELSYVIPPVIGYYTVRRQTRPARFFFVFTIIAALEMGVSHFIPLIISSNYEFANYYRLIEVAAVNGVYYFFVLDKRRNVFPVLTAVFYLFWLSNRMFFYDPGRIITGPALMLRVVLIIASVIVLQTILRDDKKRITQEPLFWISGGILIYNASTMIVLAVSNEVLKYSYDYFSAMWHINWGMIILSNLIFARGFLCK